ncbi:MAG: hypothetical protein J5882_01035 [Bacteroidales bacterium]|nr:hypothetical protein [Bacteroidales bacterium]
MKHTLYIIALAALFFITACNETVVTPDPQFEPIKDVGLNIGDVSQIKIMPDGSMLTTAILDEEGLEVCLAIVKPDGSTILSEPFAAGFYVERIYYNADGEILVLSYTYNDDYDYCYRLYKFDSKCNLLYQGVSSVAPTTLFDDGSIASFQHEFIESAGEEKLVMHILDNNLTYIMEEDIMADYAYYFDNKVLLADLTPGNFCIYKTDGSFITSGCVDGFIVDVSYIDGYLYITVRDYNFDVPDESNNYNGRWCLYKVDTDGNVVFSTKFRAYQMFTNHSLIDGTIFASGSFCTDAARNQGKGEIYMINNKSGQLIDSVSVDYTGCEVLPVHVTPDKKGGYSVYVLRQDNYDSWFDGFLGLFRGKLFVYQTDDLHKLEVSTENQ